MQTTDDMHTPAIIWKQPLTERMPHYLKGVVLVAGIEFHAEAWEVHDVTKDSDDDDDDDDGDSITYQATLPAGDNVGDDIINHIIDGDAQTISIDGKDYLFAITPFRR